MMDYIVERKNFDDINMKADMTTEEAAAATTTTVTVTEAVSISSTDNSMDTTVNTSKAIKCDLELHENTGKTLNAFCDDTTTVTAASSITTSSTSSISSVSTKKNLESYRVYLEEFKEFVPFAFRGTYSGTVCFSVHDDEGNTRTFSFDAEPDVGVRVKSDYVEPCPSSACRVSMGIEEFAKVFSGTVSTYSVTRMMLRGAIVVHDMRYNELNAFSKSVDCSSAMWVKFYDERDRKAAEAKKVADIEAARAAEALKSMTATVDSDHLDAGATLYQHIEDDFLLWSPFIATATSLPPAFLPAVLSLTDAALSKLRAWRGSSKSYSSGCSIDRAKDTGERWHGVSGFRAKWLRRRRRLLDADSCLWLRQQLPPTKSVTTQQSHLKQLQTMITALPLTGGLWGLSMGRFVNGMRRIYAQATPSSIILDSLDDGITRAMPSSRRK